MSERDELAAIVNNWGHSPQHCAKAILAAGFRRIPDDCVVVPEETMEFARNACDVAARYCDERGDAHIWRSWRNSIQDILDEAALSANRPKE